MDKLKDYLYSLFIKKEIVFKKPDGYKNTNSSQYNK